MERSEPGYPRDLPVISQKRATELTTLFRTLAAVRERRREWEAVSEGDGSRKGGSGQRLEKLIALRSFLSRWKLTLLMEALPDARPVRAEAVDQLARGYQDRRTRALLYSLLWKNDPELSLPAARAVLDHASQDPELLLRAVGALRHAAQAEDVPALLPHLQSESAQLRLATVEAIEYAAPPAILMPALLSLRTDASPAVARAALRALNGGERLDLFRSLPPNFSLPAGGRSGGRTDGADTAGSFAKRLLALARLLLGVIAAPWLTFCVLLSGVYGQPGWIILALLPMLGLPATSRALALRQERSGRALAPLLTALSELDTDANHDELQRLLRPLDRISRDMVQETWETRQACRQAAEHIRRLTAETRDLPRVNPDAVPGHDLPRTLQDEPSAGPNCMQEQMPAEAPRGSPADCRPRLE